MMTIGELAARVGLRTSALRYYEAQGLLEPTERSEAGYRLYSPESVRTVQLIQRAQRLGFSLAEIKTLLTAWRAGNMNAQDVLDVAESRYHALERQITQWQVQQHELELFLQDLRADLQADVPGAAQNAFSNLVDRICANPAAELASHTVRDWLSSTAECALEGSDVRSALDTLRGQHVHIWEEDDAYHILVVSDDPSVAEAMRQVAAREAACGRHEQEQLTLTEDEEGQLLIARGDNAYILARLFLALEQRNA